MRKNDGVCLIAASSMTYAMRAESLLKSDGLAVRIVKLPQGRSQKGCAYGVEVPASQARWAMMRLDERGIRHGDLLC